VPQQIELFDVAAATNVDVLNLIRGSLAGSDYANRVPEATQANMAEVLHEVWDYTPNRNQAVNELMNLVGLQIVLTKNYTNSFGKFKRGMLQYGESIEEIQLGLITATAYNPDAEYLEKVLFGRAPMPTRVAWHKRDRADQYKVSINHSALKQAFTGASGVASFIEQQMAAITNSDQFDEFEIMLNLFNTYHAEDGFYEIHVPDISTLNADGNDAKQNLKVLRAWAEKLPLKPSAQYNAAHMPIVTHAEDLELFITPNAKANLDVEGLAAAFNIDKANVSSRMTIIPDDDIKIPNFQWALTTKDFFVCADTFLDMAQVPNAPGRFTNFFHQHDGIYSASPFVPALVGVSTPVAPINVITYTVNGISTIQVMDPSTDPDTDVTSTGVTRGQVYIVIAAATTQPSGGPNNAVRLELIGKRSTKSHVNNLGALFIAQDYAATTVTVRVTSVDDPTFQRDIILPVSGALVYGGVGQHVDDNVTVIANTVQPTVQPGGGKVGDTFTVDPGEWDTQGLALTFQWQSNGVNVAANGTASSYTAVAGDVGTVLTCIVTAAKTGYTAGTATSAPTTAITAS
jgi:hypothetical protein